MQTRSHRIIRTALNRFLDLEIKGERKSQHMAASGIELLSPSNLRCRQAINKADSWLAWNQTRVIARRLYTAIEAAAELPQPPSLLFIGDGQSAPPVDEENAPEFSLPPAPARGVVMGMGSLMPQPIPRNDSSGRFIGWREADQVVQRGRNE